jgi:hypothetical protein
MRQSNLSYSEKKRNERLKELHSKKVNNLLISGTTNDLVEWNVEEIVSTNKPNDKDRLAEYEWENTLGKYCGGMTYLEVVQFDNSYNNFR